MFLVLPELFIKVLELIRGSGKEEDSGGTDLCVGRGELKSAPFPETNNIDTYCFPHSALDERLAHKRGPHGRRLGDQKRFKAPDDVCRGGGAENPSRQ